MVIVDSLRPRNRCRSCRKEKGRVLIENQENPTSREGAPLVQYDTLSRTFKVLAFLAPAILSRHGLLTGGTYSVSIDAAGGTLSLFMNGAPANPDDSGPPPAQAFGTPFLLIVTIPESERPE